MRASMKPFSLLIKPASADCNLACDYCFYLDRLSLYPQTKKHRMDAKTLDILIKSYMATHQIQYAFAWQGGEPTLMGLDFFKSAVALQQKYNNHSKPILNHLQTNGIAITDEFARFISQQKFLVGISLDGPSSVHNMHRKYVSGIGSHKEVIKAISRLRSAAVDINVLTMVTRVNASSGSKLYQYLREEGFDHHQYIPCVEFLRDKSLAPFALKPGQWGEFLCGLYDEWEKEGLGKVSIRYFDALLYNLATRENILCHMGKNCNLYFVVEFNGDVYPCDFYVYGDLKLGNICHDSWEKLVNSEKYITFGRNKSDWHADCVRCRYLDICGADCPKNRVGVGSGRKKSWLCEDYMMFFDHAIDGLEQIAAQLREKWKLGNSETISLANTQKVGRNQPCPCGSGKKYKKCCGA